MYGTAGGIVESPSSLTTVSPPNQALTTQREWGRGRDKGVEMTAGCFSHSAGETVQTGRYCCNNKRGQLQLSLFSLFSSSAHTPCMCTWRPRSVG